MATNELILAKTLGISMSDVADGVYWTEEGKRNVHRIDGTFYIVSKSKPRDKVGTAAWEPHYYQGFAQTYGKQVWMTQ